VEQIEAGLSRRWPVVCGRLEVDAQLVGVCGMNQALANRVRPLRTQALFHSSVEHRRHRALRASRRSLHSRNARRQVTAVEERFGPPHCSLGCYEMVQSKHDGDDDGGSVDA